MNLLDWLVVFIAMGVVGFIGLIVALALIVRALIRNPRPPRGLSKVQPLERKRAE